MRNIVKCLYLTKANNENLLKQRFINNLFTEKGNKLLFMKIFSYLTVFINPVAPGNQYELR